MMRTMKDIINYCYDIDVIANKLYKKIASVCKHDLVDFWIKMSKEEETHVLFWKEVIEYGKINHIPNIFSDIDNVYSDLELAKEKSSALLTRINEQTTINEFFVCAYWMEFYLLHPSFESLFEYFYRIIPERNPLNEYDNHIDEFTEAINRYGKISPEIELLGVTLSQLWKKNKALSKENKYDYLTSLFNRKTFINYALFAIAFNGRNSHRTSILYIDVDDFKKINDSKGHDYGDAVLKQIGRIMNDTFRSSDVISRFGGDEFTVLLSNVDYDAAVVIATKIQQNVSDSNDILKGVTISIGGSLGCNAEYSDEKFLDLLIMKADNNLYSAKKEGKNRILISILGK